MLISGWPPGVCAAEHESLDVDPDTGYRMERYRAPVPDHFPEGQTLTTADMQTLVVQADWLLIDVYPPRGLGADPLDGYWLIDSVHESLPGAIWLPDVGRGYLEPALDQYFQSNLQRLTQARTDQPMVFFCTADCWQSWNAARRATRLGYTRVAWYPLGTDGWREQDLALEPVAPVNFLDPGAPGLPPSLR